jgi:hypothetical protein
MRQLCVRSFVRLLPGKFHGDVGRAAGSLSAARTACAMVVLSLALGVLWPTVAQATTFTVTSLNDSGTGTLRAAMESAGSGDTIVFQPGLTGTITPTSLAPAIAANLTISGPGPGVITITGSGRGANLCGDRGDGQYLGADPDRRKRRPKRRGGRRQWRRHL